MFARFFKTQELARLYENIGEYLLIYKSGSFQDFGFDSDDLSFEVESVDVDISKLVNLKKPDRSSLFEVENSEIVYSAFYKLNRYQAIDPRFWTYYCHVDAALDYSRARYDKKFDSDNESLISAVRQHIFAPMSGPRMLFRNNALGRLWWNYRVALDFDASKPETILDVFMAHTDFRASIIERTSLFSNNSFKASLLFAKEKYLEDKNHNYFIRPRNKDVVSSHYHYGEVGKFLNRLGGNRNLAYLSPEKIFELIVADEKKFEESFK